MAAKDRPPAAGGGVPASPTNWLFQRLPHGIVATLSEDQQQALHAAIGDTAWSRAPVNIRISLPFIDRRFYITIVSGPEKRSAERRQIDRTRYPVRTVANVFFFVGLATVFYMAALIALALQSAIVEF